MDSLKSKQVQDFLEAYHRGFVCLHPTDTVPGLTFNPESLIGQQRIQALKKTSRRKSFFYP